ncbi:winged helix-turn-helix transcriptional regulator [Streptococcus agalactiae]|nr:winged helix-turn-helix transcriptional regulator [Streptococcus agalactiae]
MKDEILSLFRDIRPFLVSLQEENRQMIVALLLTEGGMSVSEITEKVDLSRPAVSHHLKLLLQGDLVTVEKRGKERIYSVNISCIRDCLVRFTDLIDKTQG